MSVCATNDARTATSGSHIRSSEAAAPLTIRATVGIATTWGFHALVRRSGRRQRYAANAATMPSDAAARHTRAVRYAMTVRAPIAIVAAAADSAAGFRPPAI